MRVSACSHDSVPGGTLCARCGTALAQPVDRERVRAQLKRWQEHLLDLYDNARTTVEERGVTTLHLSFGVLRWETRCSARR